MITVHLDGAPGQTLYTFYILHRMYRQYGIIKVRSREFSSNRSREQLRLLALFILRRSKRRVEVRIEDEVLSQVSDGWLKLHKH